MFITARPEGAFISAAGPKRGSDVFLMMSANKRVAGGMPRAQAMPAWRDEHRPSDNAHCLMPILGATFAVKGQLTSDGLGPCRLIASLSPLASMMSARCQIGIVWRDSMTPCENRPARPRDGIYA